MIAIFAKTDAPPDAVQARRMLAAAPHRGSCFQLRELGRCVLGVATRADFADASVSAEGPTIAALSGRLDNVAELHGTLVAAGCAPASPRDADVAAAAFRAFGGDAPSRMRGAFAGVVTDGRTVSAFRDHAGFRPLFFHDGPSALVIAAEPRQVTVGAGLPEEPDLRVLEELFYGRMPADMPAALRGVARLPQGSTLSAGTGTRPVVRRYWHPERLLESAPLDPADVAERFTDLMQQAVRRVLTGSDAVLLSGGVDSPAVAAFAAPEHRRHGRPLGALSCVFPDLPRVDERRYIELVAERLGLELHTYRPTARALDDVEAWCRVLGGPVPILSVPEVADSHVRARRLGYRNLLTGDFAEFVFGTPRHLVAHLLAHGRWAALRRLVAAERARGTSWRRLGREGLLAAVPGPIAAAYLERRGRDASQRIPAWIDRRKVGDGIHRTDLWPAPAERWRRLQLLGTEGSTVTIEAAEVCAAIAGVTLRCPFADVDLWEFFLSLPADVKCPDLRDKTLARRLLRGRLPDAVLDRRDKTYFDDHVMAQVDYPTLKRLLVRPSFRMPGVDYARLADRLACGNLNRFEWFWAKDLARIHAFLNAW